jgi:hypothetical protein
VGPYDPESAELPDVPGFRVIAAAGAGSRGVVFRARDLASQDLVALKVLEPGYASSLADAPGLDVDADGSLDAARRSIGDLLAHLAAVDAPGLVTPRRVVEVARGGEGSGPALALVMGFVDGDSLARALQRNVRFAPARAAGIAREAAAALLAAHAGGFVHGGLHPGKLVLADERTRVLGTGLGETLPEEFRPAEAAGRTSPHVYAADEVLAGDRPTEASDVFSLGAILYHLLTGLPPYKSRGLGALKVERADGPLVWPRGAMDELPPKLIKLVDAMTAAAPSGRPRLEHALLSTLASAPRSRRSFRPRASTRGMTTRVEPPRDVAPLEEPARARAHPGRGLLRRAASGMVGLLRRPSAAAVVIGGTTAVFLLALAVALRSGTDPDLRHGEAPVASAPGPREGPEVSAPAEAPGTHGGPSTPSPAAAPVPRPAAPDPDLVELEAIEQVFEANPADAEAYRARVEGLAGRAGDVGVRATALLAGLDRCRERRAGKELAHILDRAAALESAGRYGRVLALLKGFPHDLYPGTAASTRARLEAEAVRRRAGEAFAKLERRVRDLLIAGDFAGARAEYESVKGSVGLDDIIERADEGLRRVGRLEEEAAQAAAERRAKAEVESLHKGTRRAFADLARLCRAFRYTEAEKLLAAELAKTGLALKDFSGPAAEKIAKERGLLENYGELVRWEAAQFRRIAERIRTGKKKAVLGFTGSSGVYTIRAIGERGLTVTEGEVAEEGPPGPGETDGAVVTDHAEEGSAEEDEEGEIEFTWNGVPDKAAYALMVIASERRSVPERLAAAVFAHHRGMTDERDQELRIAAKLAPPAEKAIVRQVREILDRIEIAP